MIDLIFKAEEFIGKRVQVQDDRYNIYIGTLINVAQKGALVIILINVESLGEPPRLMTMTLMDIIGI